ncbi:acetyltransferase [Brevibacillus sp. SKDU10]|uniref:GNAT family N-acetyltransferase n=1 Tax=Brevibacillus sp. SKDU10 TaxID=1247872 RepID=UPI0007C8C3ED|nr:GNAT family N-acetyltransferase [Brevibacillus sp. SKDU10]OAJ75345.1 acetyltransferase [Brevibacillus sp. SKDU10]
MKIELVKVSLQQKMILRHLIELYQYDFSEFDHADVNEHGLYDYLFLDHYWTESARIPFFVKVDEKYAGFVLLRKIRSQEIEYYSIAEFFIMRKYRKRGIGRKVAFRLFHQFQGEWEISQIEQNISAQKFWRTLISEYTNHNYQEFRREDWNGPIQKFSTIGIHTDEENER